MRNGRIWTVVSWSSVSIVLPCGENKIGSGANRVGGGGGGGAEQEKENDKRKSAGSFREALSKLVFLAF